MVVDAEHVRCLVERCQTPLFAYDADEILRRVQRVKTAFGSDVGLLYSLKANPCSKILKLIRPVVDGLDVASLGELDAGFRAGFEGSHMRLAGPGKPLARLPGRVFRQGTISIEAPDELTELARRVPPGNPVQVVLRLEPRTPLHAFGVKMGRPSHPFGMDAEETTAALEIIAGAPRVLHLKGVHVYGGTQCRNVRAWLTYLAEVLDLAASVRARVGALQEVHLGGGFGVATRNGPELDVEALGPRAQKMLSKFAGPRFVLELGRFLVADAGVYLTSVVRIKQRGDRRFAVLDGGVHHLWAATGQLGPRPRAAVFRPRSDHDAQTWLQASPVPDSGPGSTAASGETHLVGPLCTPLDSLGSVDVELEPGDRIAFLQSGAYGLTLSPTRFLGHEPPAEVLFRRAHDGMQLWMSSGWTPPPLDIVGRDGAPGS